MKRKLTLLATAMAALCAWADLPVKLVNNSGGEFADSDIYIAIIGKQGKDAAAHDIYYDIAATANNGYCTTGNLTTGLNTLHLTGGDWGYANIFTRLSDIKDKTIYLGDTYACRMFVSFRSPMYMHVHETGGYAGADMNNPTDPNANLRWELVEFTYEPAGSQIWINTTRVDAFQYPMGLELYSSGNIAGPDHIKRGEFTTYQEVISKWNSSLGGTVYKDCLYNLITKDNLGGIIKQPSKVSSIKSANIFGGYIDKIWDYFRNNTANINMGMLGRWEGRVSGNQFTLTCKEGHYWPVGSQAHIYDKPSTEDAIEGAGQFANAIAGGNQAAIDKTVQAMFCAAFNRGMIRATTDLQDWNPDGNTKAFQGGDQYPHNKYVEFFHRTDISVSNGKTYAFAYDDTFDQSATCYSTAPTSVTVTIGGFRGDSSGDSGSSTTSVPGAPEPDKDAANVKSIYSGKYSTIAPDMFVGNWEQTTSASVQSCDGNDAYRFTNFNYVGLQLCNGDNVLDVTDMQYLHLDLYALTDMDINIYPISLNPTVDTAKSTRHLTAGQWNQFDIPLSDFSGVDFARLGQFKFDNGTGQTFYLDNLYFWKDRPNKEAANPVAWFYPSASHGGTGIGLQEGDYPLSELKEYGINNDDIESIKVLPGFKVEAFRDDNYAGGSVTYTADAGTLGDWANKISSLKIQPNGVSGIKGNFKILNRNSGKYLDISTDDAAKNSDIFQNDDEGASPTQTWTFDEIGNGVYYIRSFVNSANGFDIYYGGTANRTQVLLFTNTGGTHQQFILVDKGDGYYQIVARNCGRVVEIPESKTGNGEWIKLWDNNGTATQQWGLRANVPSGHAAGTLYKDVNYAGQSLALPEGSYTARDLALYNFDEKILTGLKVAYGFKMTLYKGDNFTGEATTYASSTGWVGDSWNDQTISLKIEPNGVTGLSGNYRVQNRNSGKFLDTDNNATNDATNVIQYDDENDDSQIWVLNEVETGVYTISPKNDTSKVLDVQDASTQSGATVQLYTANGGTHQQFIAVDKGDGYYHLTARNSSMVIEIPDSSTDNGAWIKTHEPNADSTQLWRLKDPAIQTSIDEISDGTISVNGNILSINGARGQLYIHTVSGQHVASIIPGANETYDLGYLQPGIYLAAINGSVIKIRVK